MGTIIPTQSSRAHRQSTFSLVQGARRVQKHGLLRVPEEQPGKPCSIPHSHLYITFNGLFNYKGSVNIYTDKLRKFKSPPSPMI